MFSALVMPIYIGLYIATFEVDGRLQTNQILIIKNSMSEKIGELSGQYLKNIKLGMEVDIVLKRDQRTGKLTRGIVRWMLTNKSYHSFGIKVMLETRQVGRVQKIIGYKEEAK